MGFLLKNRTHAGQQLAAALSAYHGGDTLVLALPRGGVPVAYEIARLLEAELDIFMVRKLGVPFHPELAMGAIASGGACVFNHEVIHRAGVTPTQIDAIIERGRLELEQRERDYRDAEPRPAIRGRSVIVVDDGAATGASMLAAVQALRSLNPSRIVIAVAVAPLETIRLFKAAADDCVYLAAPAGFDAVSQWYRDFRQVTDDRVRDLLRRERQNHAGKEHGSVMESPAGNRNTV